MSELRRLSDERQALFGEVERKLHFQADIYTLGERFEQLPDYLRNIVMLDVTKIPGCHYGLKNVFVPIIEHMEETGVEVKNQHVEVIPENVILVEPSTGNGWVAFSDAAEALGYEHIVIMPEGLPEARYRDPKGRNVRIIKTPKEEYAAGMPKALRELLHENQERLSRGEKIFATPNHPVSAADITVETMSELGKQLIDQVGANTLPLRTVVSMGNGASICALGEYVKKHKSGSKVTATESLAYGGGYDRFAMQKGLPRYKDLFGIEPGNKKMMVTFKAFGTNAPIGIELPLQTRAIQGDLIDNYVLFTDNDAMKVFGDITSLLENLEQARKLPNYSSLPQALYDAYGNSTLANIATAVQYADKGELVVAMAYDGRENYK